MKINHELPKIGNRENVNISSSAAETGDDVQIKQIKQNKTKKYPLFYFSRHLLVESFKSIM